jgi:asparagine synthase (glutamine-hydrolysing)
MLGFIKLTKDVNPLKSSIIKIYQDSRLVILGECDFLIHDDGDYLICHKGVVTKFIGEYEFDKDLPLSSIRDLYLKRGNDFSKFCDGLFLIIIYDKKLDKVIIANNRYQTSTLYYYCDEYNIFFSSSLRNLIDAFIENPKPHFGSIKSFVSTGFTIPDQVQIEGVRKLLPTFSIVVNKGEFKLFHHWDGEFSFERRKKINLEKELSRYEEIYQRGLLDYFDVYKTDKLGCLLSGGHDTSFALIQASKIHPKKIHTFTTTFPNWMWSEEDYARNISNKFNTQFHAIPFLPEDIDLILEVIKATEEPVVSVTIPIMKMAKYASDYVDTIIGGDGGDTLWGEYYPVEEFQKYVRYLPLWGRKLIHRVAKTGISITDWERFWELEHVSSLFTKENYCDDFLRRLCTYRHFNDTLIDELFLPSFQEIIMPRSIKEIEFKEDNFHQALIEGKLFNGFYTYMSFFTFKEMESQNLKLYFPTINKELMEFITTLPKEWINGGTTFHRITNHKSINRRFHKRALAKYLKSEEIYNRSFDIPWYLVLKPRKNLIYLLLKRLKERGWYKEQTLDRIFYEFENQTVKDYELLELKHHGYRIYTLLALEVWALMFIDGKPINDKTLEEYLDT